MGIGLNDFDIDVEDHTKVFVRYQHGIEYFLQLLFDSDQLLMGY